MANENGSVKAAEQLVEVGAATPPSSGALATLEQSLAAVEAREQLFQRVAEVAIRATDPSHWTDLGGKPWPTGPCAETIALRFGVRMTNMRRERIAMKDQHGEYSLWVYTAQFSLPGGAHVLEAEGTCSSRDTFIGIEPQGDTYDEGSVMKAALTNCRINGVMQILGLRGMTFERLARYGIRREDVPKVEFKGGAKGGGRGQSSDDVEIKFAPRDHSEWKGKMLSELPDDGVRWYLSAWQRDLADPEKEKFHNSCKRNIGIAEKLLAARANTAAGTTTQGGPAAPTIWQRIKALPEAKGMDEKALGEAVKEATGKGNAKELTEDDIPKVQAVLKKDDSDIRF